MNQADLLLLFGFSACVANTPSTTTAVKAKGDNSIAGQIQYPAKVVPAMQVCAINTQTQATCYIKIKAGQTKYLIIDLAAAEYQVLASVKDNELRVGGHRLQVQCIRAPCPALLNSVLLKAKESKTGTHLNGFYPSRADFPTVPAGKS